MFSIPLNKGDFYESHTAFRLTVIHSTCSSNLQSDLKVTHTNKPQFHCPASRTSFSDAITSCRKTAVVL